MEKAEVQSRIQQLVAIMDEITRLLVEIRGEPAPAVRFDPKKSNLPRTGNFKKKR